MTENVHSADNSLFDGERGIANVTLPRRHTFPDGRPAVFLDRDGTINEEVHFLTDPKDLRILPGAADGIRRLRNAGYACVVVTNQSAIGRGMMSENDLVLIHDQLRRLLADQGSEVDAIYFCPVAPGDDPSDCLHPDRKPMPGMLFRAAVALKLDLDASWMVGDSIRDILAGIHAGCRGNLLVRTGHAFRESDLESLSGGTWEIVDDLHAAAGIILSRGKLRPPPER